MKPEYYLAPAFEPGPEGVDGSEVLLEDFSIEKQQTVKRLVLGAGGNAV